MISLVIAMALAAAPDTAAAAAPAPAKAEKAKDGLICKKEPVLGSRMPKRVCLTEEQWAARKNDARDELEAAQRNQPMRVSQ